jgi:aspartate aminotransferase-like enzyme
MNYALHEALRLVLDEGLENRWRRHERMHTMLRKGIEALGMRIASQEGHQLWQLNAISVPEGVDEAAVRKRLLNDWHRLQRADHDLAYDDVACGGLPRRLPTKQRRHAHLYFPR